MEHDAVIVEVGLNEAVSPLAHPRVPQAPEECAADARRCADAGASVAHWHAVDRDGFQRLDDAALYGAALDAMAGCLLAYPSYRTDVPDTVDDRLGHCMELRRRHGLELAPIDLATVNLLLFDDRRREVAPVQPTAGFDVIRNSVPFVVSALKRYREVGLVPTLASFDLGSTRAIALLAEAGLLPEPVLCKIFLWGRPAIGPVPEVPALDLHLRQLPKHLDVEWVVVPYGIDDPGLVESLARAALERGGGVRVGVGDCPVAFPGSSNASLVERVQAWAQDVGRSLAGADELRARLGITGGERPS